MMMFSDCSGPCLLCTAGGAGGGCLAGHGDDDFQAASCDRLKRVLETGLWGGKPGNREFNEQEIEEIKRHLKKYE